MSNRNLLSSIAIAVLLPFCAAAAPAIHNIAGRNAQSLDGTWKAIVDPYENGYYNYRMQPMAPGSTFFADLHFFADQTRLIEYDFDVAGNLQVPGDWNTQREKLYYYEGTIWYRRLFDAAPKPGYRYFIHFDGANYETIAGLNGRILGKHVGGFTAFDFEVTDQLKAGQNSLIVKVDNKRHVDGVPTINTDWWNYGGITRSVHFVEVPATFIRDYTVRLSTDGGSVEGWVQLDGSELVQTVRVEIPELKVSASVRTGGDGRASFIVPLPRKSGIRLWCPEDPKLYDVKVSSDTDSVTDRIGLRTVTTQGSKILLNGKEIFLRGISIHDERPGAAAGRAFSAEHARTTLGWAKEMGCNFVRLAHYPHNEQMVRMADEMGMLVWSEIPVYWTIAWDSAETYANAENQLCEMIGRDHNRAAVIIWSVANETPRSPQRLTFLTKLIDKTRSLDPTRLVSAAMEKDQTGPDQLTLVDELMYHTDLLSFNQYVGWYDGNVEKCDRVKWTFPVDKPVILSELGGGAKYGRHGSPNERFTEEYLVRLYEANIRMMKNIPGLAGCTPWILKDFRSPRRALDGIQDDFNRKGLLSEKGEKKDAFYTLQAWYKSF
ncbi:MAG: beta-glucuronidase [Bacteroidales bacterium]|nr:beta-glucuronidase [Bacteroidales bacterium]